MTLMTIFFSFQGDNRRETEKTVMTILGLDKEKLVVRRGRSPPVSSANNPRFDDLNGGAPPRISRL